MFHYYVLMIDLMILDNLYTNCLKKAINLFPMFYSIKTECYTI